jgi:TorA maturation chaperone TorD
LSIVAASAAAQAATLLSGWWSRPVEDELAAWDASWPAAAETAEALGLDAGAIEELAARSAGVTAEELLDEYERLFVGPGRTPCPPYESLWLGGQPRLEQGRLMGAASVAVADLYRRLGLDVAAAAHELPDHVAIELEALAVSLRAEDAAAEEARGALLHEHLLSWLPAFCAAVEREARQPFYVVLARVTTAWVERLACDAPGP